MKNSLFACLLVCGFSLSAQPALPEFQTTKTEVEAHLRFLASDALQGRRTGAPGNNIAAQYIAAHLEAYGFQKVPGASGYFQPIPFEAVKPPSKGQLVLGKSIFMQGEELLILSGEAAVLNSTAVFAGHGWVDEKTGHDDYKGLDVAGKVVFVLPGPPDSNDPLAIFRAMSTKRSIAAERGAAALIELYRLSFPWGFFRQYFNKENLRAAPKEGESAAVKKMVYAWWKEPSQDLVKSFQTKKTKVKLESNGFSSRPMPSQNVIGVLEGSDPVLKNEYVLLTAHYDHVGTGKDGGAPFTPQDSIFNGTRDNAMGTVALIAAAKSFAQQRPKRSILFLAVTGEELGLLGSQYYAENPLIPLNQVIFNLNIDNGGYNTTEHISIVGHGRTGTDDLLQKGIEALGLKVIPNPAPEQNLFDRSDNVSFAAKGIPALCFSLGITGFDDTIAKYYHQVTDNPDSIDYDYFLKYCQSFAYTTRLIADDAGKPRWVKGDKYEKAGKALYGLGD
ncbi:MAG: M20/M25/M40 family metallo-hydrolase [Saprospiraceae bacterium]|nr:M20/M25/M40 family metallo-hydrolase [Saprospiraceae bacterium]